MRMNRRLFLKALSVGAGALTLRSVWGWGQQPPVKVGLIGPIDLLDVGRAMVRGAQLALEEINKLVDEKKLPPPKLTMEGLIRDDQVLRGDVARAAFEELVEKGAQVIVGGFLDEAVMGIMPSLARLKRPFLNTGTSGKQFSELVKSDYERYKYYFRLMFNTEVLGQDAAIMAKGLMREELGVEKVALVMEDSNFGRDFLKILQARLPSEAGIQIATAINFPVGNPDFAAILQQVSDSGADAIIPAFAFNPGIPFVGQTYELRVDAPVIGIITEGQAFEYWKSTGGRVMGHAYADAATGETPITPKTLPFFLAYTERYGESPPSRPLYTAFTTYDALFILKEALDRAKGSTDADRLVEELEKTDYIGTVGRVQFQGKNDPFPHDPKYGPEYVVAKWVLWTTLARDPLKANPQKDPLRVVIWPKQYRLRSDGEGRPISIDACISKAAAEYRAAVDEWKKKGKPKGGRFEAWQAFTRSVAKCFAG
ncbi:MAG: ABC transporter substrate-binding protein [Candidatus Bipolaricaulota bacterium]|nr:ABC transporter substrate-binding protein [Candidatus Bipolaricaulota bacterium]MDW8030778.1 ABC transporter substrate-binding protein [Candidatus Bipolaricaulota bacterium]